jgi:hypothetical protein
LCRNLIVTIAEHERIGIVSAIASKINVFVILKVSAKNITGYYKEAR